MGSGVTTSLGTGAGSGGGVGGEGGQSQQLGISLVTFHTFVFKLGVNSQQASGVPIVPPGRGRGERRCQICSLALEGVS